MNAEGSNDSLYTTRRLLGGFGREFGRQLSTSWGRIGNGQLGLGKGYGLDGVAYSCFAAQKRANISVFEL